MKTLANKIYNILKRGGLAFLHYPISMLSAICLAGLSIWMTYAEPDTNLKLLNSLLWAFALGTFLGMALCVISKKADGKNLSFILANAVTFILCTGVFLILLFSAEGTVSGDAAMRVAAAMAVSFLVFLFVPTFKSTKIHYNQMVFMTLKSFFVAAVYSLVIMLGCFFIAFAVQSLLYSDMSEKVYVYIAILSGLLGYAFFLGYFPEFRKDEPEDDERTDKAIRQPRFAEILFQNILIPIVAALTVVLLIWAIRILITRDWPDYTQTIAIFTTYALFGIFLYYLVSSYDTLLARLYRKIIPITTLVFLAFEAYPIIHRIGLYGVKPAEYAVVFLCLFAVVTSVLFLFLPIIKNRVPSYIAIALIVLIVLPGLGASDLSFSLQTKRLENLLTKNSMLVSGEIVAGENLTTKDQQDITDATNYLYGQENKTAPDWLLAAMPDTGSFEAVYGFPQSYYGQDGVIPGGEQHNLTLRPENSAFPISDYDYYLLANTMQNGQEFLIETDKGVFTLVTTYSVDYDQVKKGLGDSKFTLTVSLDGQSLLQTNLEDYIAQIVGKYPVGSSGQNGESLAIPVGEMTYTVKGDGVQVMVLFNSITLTEDSSGNKGVYFEINGVCFKEIG
jgi:hypothetical protein